MKRSSETRKKEGRNRGIDGKQAGSRHLLEFHSPEWSLVKTALKYLLVGKVAEERKKYNCTLPRYNVHITCTYQESYSIHIMYITQCTACSCPCSCPEDENWKTLTTDIHINIYIFFIVKQIYYVKYIMIGNNIKIFF